MLIYDPRDQYFAQYECLVEMWFHRLRASDDFLKVMHSSLLSITDFLNHFAHGAKLVFEIDKDGIWFAAWTQRIYSGAEFGMWIREDKRHTKSALKAVKEAYDLALSDYPVLIGITKQPELHNVHLKLGYKYHGLIRSLVDGADVHLYSMTAQSRADVRALKYSRLQMLIKEQTKPTQAAMLN